MYIKKIIIFLGLWLLLCSASLAQKKLSFVCGDSAWMPHRGSGVQKRVRDSAQLSTQLDRLSRFYQSRGYLSFSVDSVGENSDGFQVFVFLGECYDGRVVAVPDTVLPRVQGSATRLVKNGTFRYKDYPELAEALLSYYENHGFPFASVNLENVDFEKDTIASLEVSTHEYVTFDSLILSGSAKVRPGFLKPYLGWRPGKKYVERTVSQMTAKLQKLPFVSIVREPGIEFVNDQAFLYLFLDRQRVNQFDGYIGFVPVSERTGKLMVTGEVNLNLQNIFKIGESFSIKWQSPERFSQYLRVAADFPCLFRTPLGVAGSFLLDKKDTTYLNMNYWASLQYAFDGSSSLHLYFDYATSTVLDFAPLQWLPGDTASCDYRRTMYGVKLNYVHLDNAIQPWKGWQLQADFSAGARAVLRNAQVPDSWYEGVEMKTSRYRISGRIAGYVPIRRRWGWVGCLSAATLLGRQFLYNELFRIGGTSTLQGFDEMSIYASSYLMAQTEFRFRFAPLSYINVFFNTALYECRVSDSCYTDIPFGFGLGVTFHTRAGNLYLSYALGQKKDSPLSFKTGKIHFGLDVRF